MGESQDGVALRLPPHSKSCAQVHEVIAQTFPFIRATNAA
jgi:hypothetical protein